MARGSEEMDKFMKKHLEEELIDAIKWLEKILKGMISNANNKN